MIISKKVASRKSRAGNEAQRGEGRPFDVVGGTAEQAQPEVFRFAVLPCSHQTHAAVNKIKF